MTQHFTSPEFAQLLKEHGIGKETPFVWANVNGNTLLGTIVGSEFVELTSGDRYELDAQSEPVSAYMILEVLGWLPFMLIDTKRKSWWLSPDYNGEVITYAYQTSIIPSGEAYTITENFCEFQPIEDLLAQGLTEGWLTKENLNL